jgi:LCP family protein required for cell wall assembly
VRRALAVGALACATALLWASLGSVQIASGKTPAAIVARAHDGGYAPTFTKPIFILALGGDARQGNPEHVRTDSIHIIAIDPVSLKGSIVGIPRDSYVPIPGHGTDKINAAGFFGGPSLVVQTVENLSGCTFDYSLLTSFYGFVHLVDDFGGVPFTVDGGVGGRGYHESVSSHIDLNPGFQVLSGSQALSWARDRHVGRPRGDFDRSIAQAQLMVAALSKARKQYASAPGSSLHALAAMMRNVKSKIPAVEAIKLGLLALRVNPDNVRNIVLDGAGANVDGASVVQLAASATSQLHDVCDDGVLENS